jgi:hypothetical protein
MTSIYILFLVAPLVTHLGTYPSLEECNRVAQVVAFARHKGDVKEAEIFGANRLVCVKSSLIK